MRFFLVFVVPLEKIHSQRIYLCLKRRHELASRDGKLVRSDDTGYVAFCALEQFFMEIQDRTQGKVFLVVQQFAEYVPVVSASLTSLKGLVPGVMPFSRRSAVSLRVNVEPSMRFVS